jgi:hypothetical protein
MCPPVVSGLALFMPVRREGSPGRSCYWRGNSLAGKGLRDTATQCFASLVHAYLRILSLIFTSKGKRMKEWKGQAGWARGSRYWRKANGWFGFGSVSVRFPKCGFWGENAKKFGLSGLARFSIAGRKPNGEARYWRVGVEKKHRTFNVQPAAPASESQSLLTSAPTRKGVGELSLAMGRAED